MTLHEFCELFASHEIHPRHLEPAEIHVYEICGYDGENADFVELINPLLDGGSFNGMDDRKVLYACPHPSGPGVIKVFI